MRKRTASVVLHRDRDEMVNFIIRESSKLPQKRIRD